MQVGREARLDGPVRVVRQAPAELVASPAGALTRPMGSAKLGARQVRRGEVAAPLAVLGHDAWRAACGAGARVTRVRQLVRQLACKMWPVGGRGDGDGQVRMWPNGRCNERLRRQRRTARDPRRLRAKVDAVESAAEGATATIRARRLVGCSQADVRHGLQPTTRQVGTYQRPHPWVSGMASQAGWLPRRLRRVHVMGPLPDRPCPVSDS
jgi:hypothetical protein